MKSAYVNELKERGAIKADDQAHHYLFEYLKLALDSTNSLENDRIQSRVRSRLNKLK